MPQRPDKFTIDPHHHLANGLVFAGLGANAGSTLYHDSSLWSGHANTTDLVVQATSIIGRNFYGYTGVVNGGITNIPLGTVMSNATKLTTVQWMLFDAGGSAGGLQNWETDTFLTRRSTTSYQWYTFTSGQVGGTFHSVSDNTLYHFAHTYDGANMEVYKDGVASGSPKAQTGGLRATSEVWHINYNYTNDSCYWGDVMVWLRVLSQSEIRILANRSDPMLSGLIRPPMRRWWPVSGGGGGVTIDCTVGAVAIAGQNPSISVGTTINCTVGAIAIADYACDISVGTTINCTLGAVAIAGQNTTIIAGTTIDCTSGALAITGNACSIAAGTTITCTTGAVTVAGNACSISTGTTIACTSGAVTVVGNAAEVTQTTQINCTLGAIVLAALAVDIQATTTVNCTLASLAISGHDVTISLTGNVVPDGVDYRVTDLRPHYSVTDSRPHYRSADTRPHYRA